jgi:hypothetical protein
MDRTRLPAATLWLLLLGACETSGVTYVGPGDGRTIPVTDTSATGAGAACDKRNLNGTCVQFTGAGWDADTMQASCDGTMVDGCPDSALGGCKLAQQEALEQIVYYYEGAFYIADDEGYLRGDCEVNFGEWL